MQLQTFNLKAVFIALLWGIVVICGVIAGYYSNYIQYLGHTDSKLWIDTAFYGSMALIAFFIILSFDKRKVRKRFYQKQLEILNLFENQSQSLISLNQILSKSPFSESETKGFLEHLVEKKILIPSFSEEQKLIYRLTDNDSSLHIYLKKMK